VIGVIAVPMNNGSSRRLQDESVSVRKALSAEKMKVAFFGINLSKIPTSQWASV
jgi:hypothetical protein